MTGRSAPDGAAPAPSTPPVTEEPPAPVPGLTSTGLITLDAGFDVEAFSKQLGEPAIRVVVPRENLLEVLTRAAEFMAFGIYVYAIEIRPSPTESLRAFEVELRRVDYSPAARAWLPFQERGRSSSPFGPSDASSGSGP